jgi:hypothetical protein
MTNEGLKASFPGEQHGADHLGREISRRTDWSQHGASWTRLVAPSNAASNPDHWRRKVSQLQDNLASLDLWLSAEQLKSLDGASRIELGLRQSIYEKETIRATRFGSIWDRLLL